MIKFFNTGDSVLSDFEIKHPFLEEKDTCDVESEKTKNSKRRQVHAKPLLHFVKEGDITTRLRAVSAMETSLIFNQPKLKRENGLMPCFV